MGGRRGEVVSGENVRGFDGEVGGKGVKGVKLVK